MKGPLFMATMGLVILLTVGCGEDISQVMQSWIGHSYSELMASWGPPTQVFSDGKGGQIFVYAYNRLWIRPGVATTAYSANAYGGYVYGSATTVYSPAYVQGYTAYRMFWIDSDGIIYSWAWRGL
jgi:hypothetical protein